MIGPLLGQNGGVGKITPREPLTRNLIVNQGDSHEGS